MDKPFESTILPKPSPGNKEEAYLYKTAAGVVGRLNETGGFDIESDLNESILKIEGKVIGTTASQVVMDTGYNLNDTIGGLWETYATTVTSTTGSVEITNPIRNSKTLSISLSGNTLTCKSANNVKQLIDATNKDYMLIPVSNLAAFYTFNARITSENVVGDIRCFLCNSAGEKLTNSAFYLKDGTVNHSFSTISKTDMQPKKIMYADTSPEGSSATIVDVCITKSESSVYIPPEGLNTLASFEVGGLEYSVIEDGKIVEVPKGSTYTTTYPIPLTATTTLNVLGATPTNLEVIYPMRNTATMSHDLQQMKAMLNSKSNTHIIANYVEDEYKKELSRMEGL